MESNEISSPRLLPDEIILKILNKVSLETLHRFKWVSKSWFSLVTDELLSKVVVKSPNVDFYYTRYSGRILENQSLKSLYYFLSSSNINPLVPLDNIDILDCCGGLVFCSVSYEERDPFLLKTYYYVCNPVDRSYNQILSVSPRPLFLMLDFNPLISPHYKLIVVAREPSFTSLEFGVYHSEKRRFEKVHVSLERTHSIITKRRHIALWKGNVYLHGRFYVYSDTVAQDITGYENKIWAINGVLGGSQENIICRFITFPKQSKVYPSMFNSYLGTWRDMLRFVSVDDDDDEIRVWALRDSEEDEWTLEHECPCFFNSIKHSPRHDQPKVVGLHPFKNAVLFMFGNLLHAYDLDRMFFEKVCEIEDGVGCEFSPGLVFPFSPCFAKDVLI